MEASLIWIGFKELLIERFTPKYYKLLERINLVQMKHIRSVKVYVRNFNTKINATPRMEEFAKKCMFLMLVAEDMILRRYFW